MPHSSFTGAFAVAALTGNTVLSDNLPAVALSFVGLG